MPDAGFGSPEDRRGRAKDGFGVNLIGFATANLGQGVALRNTARLLERRGIPFCVVDVDPGGNRTGKDLSLKTRLHDASRPLPHPVNLFQMNPPELKPLLERFDGLLRTEERMNVCVPFWELGRLPPAWIPVLQGMDMILAPSRFVLAAVESDLDGVPCRYYRQFVAGLPSPPAERSASGRLDGRFRFVCSFDASSDFQRKNPAGVAKAFAHAFSDSPESAELVLKINNSGMNVQTATLAAQLALVVSRVKGITLVDKVMPYEDVIRLYAEGDAYVSLHRSEGLGLGIMESMMLGKPAIATGWSGNMDFMDDNGSCLVGHHLVPVGPDSTYFEASGRIPQQWAEPSIEEAARWMRRLAEDSAEALSIGMRGNASIRKFLQEAAAGEVFDSLRAYYLGAWRRPVPWRAGDRRPEVLIQNRNEMDLLPGGDTIVARGLVKGFRSLGMDPLVSLAETRSLRDVHLVQLINITRARDSVAQARNARRQGRPVVVLPLYEDLDRYLVKATNLDFIYAHLARTGQVIPPDQLLRLAEELNLPEHPLHNETSRYLGIGDAALQREIMAAADHVITSGRTETDLLRGRFEFQAPVSEIPFGIDPVFGAADPGPFRAKHGSDDFALCVGRIEVRKNIWTLIEVFRGLPDRQLVIVGFFDNPSIESAVRAFAPPNVRFLQGLSVTELASAFAAARLHVLPSWYELPGLVSMEAAAAGTRVVTTSWGTARDAFGDRVHYCEPDRPDSIRRAVLDAWDSRLDPALRDFARDTFDWRHTARRLRTLYQELLDRRVAA